MSNDEVNESNLRRTTKIVIDSSGEYVTEQRVAKIISHPDIEIPLPIITKYDIVRRVLFPDIVDVIMFTMTFFLNFLIVGGLTGLSVYDGRMIVTWGYISFLFVIPGLYRRSISFTSRKINELDLRGRGSMKMMTDLHLSGLVGSVLLVLIGNIMQF